LLMAPTAPQDTSAKKETIGKKREQALDDVLGTPSKK
jgi:hypothetical protein